MHNLSNFIHANNEPVNSNCRFEMQRPRYQIWCETTPDKGLYEWYGHYNHVQNRSKMEFKRHRKASHIDQNEFQRIKVLVTRSKEGYSYEERAFKLSDETISTIQEKSIKSLSKRIDRSLMDAIAIQETKDNLEKCLTTDNKSCLRGRCKALIYQHAILSKILWPLSMNLPWPT